MKTRISLSVLMALASVSFAQNKDIESTAEIKSITIYNSSAEINYQKEVSLPAGKNTVVFTDLTPFIVENTVNISASSADVDIITVTEKINYTKDRKDSNKMISGIKDSISHLENEIGLLKVRAEALNMEKDLLFKGESIGGVSKGVAVAEIEKASAFFNKRYLELTTELFNLSEKEKSLTATLANYNNQMKEMSTNTSKQGSEIRITVNNPSQKNVMFTFKFLTAKGGWAPVYDCKYKGQGIPLEFIFRANVFNASGTPWENVDIKLSTANPTGGFDTPSFNKKKDKPTQAKAQTNGEVQFKEIEVANSIAEYDIKHKYTIPSDSKPYLVDVNSYSMNAEYYYLTIPKLDPWGFLMAKIPDWNKFNLIPGTTNIYNKGSYMGKTFLDTYAENDTLSLYLGKDNNIQAVKKEVSTTNQHNIIGNSYVEKTDINISIKNSSQGTFSVRLLDQVPVFDIGEKVKFTIDNVEQAIYDKYEGLLIWDFQLAQGENKMISYRYDIKFAKEDLERYLPKRKRFRTIKCPSF